MEKYNFKDFMDIIRKLRSEEGCPWDREQTHESLKTCLIEECYETIEAINNGDDDNLCEELGDLLLQVALHSVIAEENGEFTVEDVVSRVGTKMVIRHPHVFGEVTVNSTEEVLSNWEEIKRREKKSNNLKEELLDIPKAFPAVIRAEKVLKKVSGAGVNPDGSEDVFGSIILRLEKLKKTMKNGTEDHIFEEFGDIVFGIIKLSLLLHLNAENSLTNATNKFINRFVDVFTLAEGKGQDLCDISTAERKALWRDIE